MRSLFEAQRRREKRKERIQVFALVIAIAGGMSIVTPEDIDDKIRIECTQLIGGWHPDIPTKKSESCK